MPRVNNLMGTLLLFAFLCIPSLTTAAKPKKAILLSEVQSLTLHGSGALTTHRRVSAIPQLKCVSSKSLCRLHEIDVMRCENAGASYGDEDIEWSCTASLPEELKLGSTEVICEGYASSDDPYVLKGSCGVEYRLLLTAKGEQRYPDLAGGGGWLRDDIGRFDWSAMIFYVFFVGILGWMVYSACCGAGRGNRRTPGAGGGRWGGGGGGGGGGGDNDPPPPYPGSKPYPPSSEEQTWRPGFWSGAAAGAAGGYAASAWQNRQREQQQQRYGYGGIGGSDSWDAGPSTPSRSTRSRSSQSSGARHESTGFGSTSRR